MAKETKIKDSTENMTPEEVYVQAQKNMQYAHEMDMPGICLSFYDRAVRLFERVCGNVDGAEEALQDALVKRNEMRAVWYLERLGKAREAMNDASSAADFEKILGTYKQLRKDMETSPIEEVSLSDSMKKQISALKGIEDDERKCRAHAEKLNKKSRNKKLFGLVLLVACIVAVCMFTRTPKFVSCKALAADMAGKDGYALKCYESIYEQTGEEKDKQKYLSYACEKGKKALEKNDAKKALILLKVAAEEDFEDSGLLYTQAEKQLIAKAEVEEKVEFAGNNWILLEKSESDVLLMYASYCEVQMPATEDYSWETSQMRAYLNGQFLDENFLKEEKESIITSVLTNENGSETEDAVFAFSKEEFEKASSSMTGNKKMFWLRSKGKHDDAAAYVAENLRLVEYGSSLDTDCIYLRPVIRLSLTQ